jgi:hypothetical protein
MSKGAKFKKKSEPTENGAPVKLSQNQFYYKIWLFEKPAGSDFVKLSGIYRTGLLDQIDLLGFRKRYRPDSSFAYVLEYENIITAVEISQIRDSLTQYIEQLSEINIEHKGLTFTATVEKQQEIFYRNSHTLFNDAFLGHLKNHDKPILKDSKKEMFFSFSNCVVKVTKDKIETIPFGELENVCIWKDHLIKRPFHYSQDYTEALFNRFLGNVSNFSEETPQRYEAVFSATGYLLHNYSSPKDGRAVVAYDEELTGKNEPAGGTGKGLFEQGLKQMRNVAEIDGKKLKDDNQFSYQSVTERTQIIYFDDVRTDFDFLILNSNLTTGWQIEQKRKAPFRFHPSENPKTYITSNTILKAEGTTAQRRMFVLEFSPYYSKLIKQNLEPIILEHGCTFFNDEDWNSDEWCRFYMLLVEAAKYYLQKGLRFYEHVSVSQNKLIQFTSEDFAEWFEQKQLQPGDEFLMKDLFLEFKATYYGEENDFSQRAFYSWMKKGAKIKNCKLEVRKSGERYYCLKVDT